MVLICSILIAIACAKAYVLRGINFWIVSQPLHRSRSYNKVLGLWIQLGHFLKHQIGNGENTYLRWEKSTLQRLCCWRMVLKSPALIQITTRIKVNGFWILLISEDLVWIQSRCTEVLSNPHAEDSVFWNIPKSGKLKLTKWSLQQLGYVCYYLSVLLLEWIGGD